MRNISIYRKFDSEKEGQDQIFFETNFQVGPKNDNFVISQLLNSTDQFALHEKYLTLLDHPNLDIRRYTLQEIKKNRMLAAENKVIDLCYNEKKSILLSDALFASTLFLSHRPALRVLLKKYVTSQDAIVVSASMSILFEIGSPNDRSEIESKLIHFTNSSVDFERLVAAMALEHISIQSQDDLLLSLYLDPELEVREQAFKSMSTLCKPQFIPIFIENLHNRELSQRASEGLVHQGELFIDYIASSFNNFHLEVQSKVIAILGQIKCKKATEFLWRYLPHLPKVLFHAGLYALRELKFKAANDEDLKVIEKFLKNEKALIIELDLLLTNLSRDKEVLLFDQLRRELELCQERMFHLLSFYYPEKVLRKVDEGLQMDDINMMDFAIELLSETLNTRDKEMFLSHIVLKPAVSKTGGEEVEWTAFFKRVFEIAPTCYISTIASTAVFTIGKAQLPVSLDIIHSEKVKNDPYFSEAVSWVINRFS